MGSGRGRSIAGIVAAIRRGYAAWAIIIVILGFVAVLAALLK